MAELEDIEFEEIGQLVEEEFEDLAKYDPELSTEVDLGGDDILDDSDGEVDTAPVSADKDALRTQR